MKYLINFLYQKFFDKKSVVTYPCGIRNDGTFWNAEILHLSSNLDLTKFNITAGCGFFYLKNEPNKLVAVINKRGVDLPGGHVDPGENIYDSFYREVLEEAAAVVTSSKLIALLKTDYNPDIPSYIAIFRAIGNLLCFQPSSEIKDRLILTTEEFIQRYFGNKNLIKALMSI